MRLPRLALVIALPSALVATNAASAKGCLRGALVGGVAGHYAHHHAVAGALAGCAAGHMYYKHTAHQAARRHRRLPVSLRSAMGGERTLSSARLTKPSAETSLLRRQDLPQKGGKR